MITGLDHANIFTAKLAETCAFFTDVIGLKIGPRPEFGIGGAWLYSGDRPIVHLVETSEARTPNGALDHFSFSVSDFDAALARLDAHGVKYAAMEIPGGFGRQAFISDPNGVTVELTWRPA